MSDDIVLNFHDVVLRQSDLELLRGTSWITDTIISFYFEYLEYIVYEKNNSLSFVSPEVTQCIKMLSKNEVGMFLDPLDIKKKKYIFFPVNDHQSSECTGGFHWSLLVLSQPEKTFYHFDSLHGSNYESAKELKSKLAHYCKGNDEQGSYGILPVNTLQQENGYDCGIHVLCNVDVIVDHVLKGKPVLPDCPLANRSSVNNKRVNILSIIENLRSRNP